MATVFDQLADAFTRRKQALAERERPASKLAGSDYFMPQSAKQDLANRLSVFEQGGTPELLKQAAQETYQNPAVNAAIGFTPVIGDLQSAFEAVKAAKEGQWAEAGLNALGVLPFVPALKTTWHGSPHGFTKFDLSKIGTGEGAQAYGHGAYLAESRPVAEGYREALSGGASKTVNASYSQDPQLWVAGQLHSGIPKQDIAEGLQALGYKGDAHKLIEQGADRLKSELNAGYLYKVDLPDEHIAKMLDWDKPLSEQPKSVQKALSVIDPDMYHHSGNDYDPMELGQSIYQRLANQKRDYAITAGLNDQTTLGGMQYAASKELNELGIPGIQYLDQGSRGAGEGTRNYVVFDENIPTILERNGLSVFDIPKD